MIKLLKNMLLFANHVIEKQLLPYAFEWTCLICGLNIIKQKHELTLNQRKKITFSSRIKYAERKIIAICTDIIQIYDGHDYE